ncbi:hypothetical protein BESB_028990 [Besnoitia besnoiti]|uniref:Transmembrane protein n=1 Tax=Besnoitia besnoiti TaxID=94643 RepID=A0A2A9M2M1_BESBE|nr:uncharacterized protein BESB_028990 [Besnoitia besnoiti]PFH31464.1 hypothetical protein BESB_028990 [Besnoitia besnoiti]
MKRHLQAVDRRGGNKSENGTTPAVREEYSRSTVRDDGCHVVTKTESVCVGAEQSADGKHRLGDRVRRRLRVVYSFYRYCHEYKWERRQSRTIALSSLLYFLPALALLPVCQWESWLWAFTAAVSFSADYIFVGMRHNMWVCGVHMTDRYVATGMLALQIFYNVPLWFSKGLHIGLAGVMLIICSCFFKCLGTRTKVYRHHVVYHSLWHVVGGVGRVFVAALEYPELLQMWY